MLTASIESITDGLAIRVHAEGGVYGDAYDWCCVVIPHGDLAVITLAPRAPTRPEQRALRKVLEKYGFKKARWERRKGSSRMTREFYARHAK